MVRCKVVQASGLQIHLRHASGTHALLSLCAYHASGNPHEHGNRQRPWREECDCYADHADTPHDCSGALRHGSSQRGEGTALLGNDIALAVNLNRDVGRCIGFIGLCAGAILALHRDVLESA